MKTKQWRQYWLSSINELTSLELQKKSWLDSENKNPHWSFIEFNCCYFDDLIIEDDYKTELKNNYITIEEHEVIKKWHAQLCSYKSPNNDDYNHSAILKDSKWQKIITLGLNAKSKLAEIVNDKELKYLVEKIDHVSINKQEKQNLLFVCSMNQWRSRTAETIFKNSNQINVKSAGTSKSARIKINLDLIKWASKIYVMEMKHKEIIIDKFKLNPKEHEFIILDIEDNYKYMDEQLIQMLNDEINNQLLE